MISGSFRYNNRILDCLDFSQVASEEEIAGMAFSERSRGKGG